MRIVPACALGVLLATAAGAAPADPPGKAVYLQYCGACHGPEGKGDGVAGTFMRPKPSDLTRIADRHGGRFSSSEVLRYIDGRETVRAHGDPDMPVWGRVFRDRVDHGAEQRAHTLGTLLVITSYLESIQR